MALLNNTAKHADREPHRWRPMFDAIRNNPAPACTTTIHLPETWRGHGVKDCYVIPEMNAAAPPIPLTGDAAAVDPQSGTLRLRTPPFATSLLVFNRRCN